MDIFVGSLPFRLSEDELRGYFESFGEVTSARIITDKFSGKSKGFGFVEMPNSNEAEEAIESLNGKEILGRPIVVNEAREKREDDRRGGGGGGGGYRGGGNNRGGGGGGYHRD
ncbi:MAG: RNA-binding protein [Bacteroidetes bacterium GWF2_41_31]|nr:MAG: RNA-binding protein [Bacteroidetes bacterium GWF2_41_31]